MNRKTVAELLALDVHADQGIKFTCEAAIKTVDPSSGWWYRACPQCKYSIQNYNEQLWCGSCGDLKEPPIYWYKLNTVVEDSTGSTTFVIFGRQASDLIGLPASHLSQSFKDRFSLPPMMTRILGMRRIFQVVLSDRIEDPSKPSFKVMHIFQAKQSSDLVSDSSAKSPFPTSTLLRTSPAANMHTTVKRCLELPSDGQNEVANVSSSSSATELQLTADSAREVQVELFSEESPAKKSCARKKRT